MTDAERLVSGATPAPGGRLSGRRAAAAAHLPDFLLIGAARSATTSLHYYLAGHPEVCMSTIKEPNYFLCDRRQVPPRLVIQPDPRLEAKSVFSRSGYERLFRPAPGEWRIGEVSPLYLYAREAPDLISREIPDVDLVVVLRNPVDRAYSHFLHVYRGPAAKVPDVFAASVRDEMECGYTPYRTGTHFLRLGRYGEQLARYHGAFPPERLHVIVHDDLTAEPNAEMRRLCQFLRIAPDFAFETSTIYNRSGVVRNPAARTVRRVATRVQPWAKRVLPPALARPLGRVRARVERPSTPPPLDPAVRHQLIAYYEDDVHHLEELLGRDLSVWLHG